MDKRQIVKAGMRNNALKGNFNGGITLYGYALASSKIVINEYEAEAVRFMFKAAAKRMEPFDICQELKRRGFTPRQGNDFNARILKRILTNERYMGVYIFDDIRIENGFPAIVSKQLFEAVNKTRRYKK
jgi:hypothetical protein